MVPKIISNGSAGDSDCMYAIGLQIASLYEKIIVIQFFCENLNFWSQNYQNHLSGKFYQSIE